MHRRRMPQRRSAETFNVDFDGISWSVTLGFYPDGSVGELFISSRKVGSTMDAIARDASILLSLALQHHVPIETIRTALTRNLDGTPSTLIGAICDYLDRRH